LSILSIQSRLAGDNISVRSAVELRSLEDLPESKEHEEDGYADIGGEEVCKSLVSKFRLVLERDLSHIPVTFQ
jgi:hypothetical protein